MIRTEPLLPGYGELMCFAHGHNSGPLLNRLDPLKSQSRVQHANTDITPHLMQTVEVYDVVVC